MRDRCKTGAGNSGSGASMGVVKRLLDPADDRPFGFFSELTSSESVGKQTSVLADEVETGRNQKGIVPIRRCPGLWTSERRETGDF